jgi:hypothetical protein
VTLDDVDLALKNEFEALLGPAQQATEQTKAAAI